MALRGECWAFRLLPLSRDTQPIHRALASPFYGVEPTTLAEQCLTVKDFRHCWERFDNLGQGC